MRKKSTIHISSLFGEVCCKVYSMLQNDNTFTPYKINKKLSLISA